MLHMANTIIDVTFEVVQDDFFIILVFLLFRKGQRSDKMQSFVWGLLKVHFNCFSSNFPKERKTFRPFFCPQLQLIIFCERESWVDFIPYYNKEVTLCYYAALLLPKASAHARRARKHVVIRALWMRIGRLQKISLLIMTSTSCHIWSASRLAGGVLFH